MHHAYGLLVNVCVSTSSCATSGQWECKEGETEVAFTEMPWDRGEPNEYFGPGSENCALLLAKLQKPGKWWDSRCHLRYGTVCKQPL